MTTESSRENDNLNIVIQWGSQYLSSHGFTLKSSLPEIVQHTPWSYVARFTTSEGYIYLKHTPKLLALEANITQILHDQFQAPVAKVIAFNAELNSFLMEDAGVSLRRILKHNFDETLLCKAIDQFTSLQISVADHVNVFLEIGVPDWRLDKLPALYQQSLTQKDILIADGLSAIEMTNLEALIPKVSELCKKLSGFSIKQTIVQPDFNDNNTLIDKLSQDITIVDLGEIAISHPFFSLLNCLCQIKKHYALTVDDRTYLRIRDVCLNNYMAFETRENLLTVLEWIRPLWFVYGALASHRLMIACGKEKILSFQHGELRRTLKELMTAFNGLQ